MKLWSDSWTNGDRIPARHAAGRPDGHGQATFSDNLNPHLAWSEIPQGTQSFALICHDFDVPSRADDVNQPDREVPVDLPRVDFFHWLLVDLPPTVTGFAEGQWSRGFTARGKAGPATDGPARQGLNDYTGWFAGDAQMKGNYFGYDGPCPPWNDSIRHRYLFTVYALDVPALAISGAFNGQQARNAMAGHILAQASLTVTYSLNPGVPA